MIQLYRHIEILLLNNDCVIVPGLGGFMAHHIEARYDEADGTFVPPLRTLGFNPQLTMNDSLLVQSYVEAYDMSYPEALRRIEAEVVELRQCLEKEGRYELNDIGTLSLNEDGKLVFSPCEAGILTPELYGLSSFMMSPLATSQGTAIPAEATVAEEVPLTDDRKEEAEEEEDGERAIVIKMSWLRNAAAVAAAVLAFILMTTPVSNSGEMGTASLSGAMFSSIMPKDTAKKVVVPVKQEQPAPPQPEATQPKADSTVYSIVLASYVTKKNAQAFVESLHKKGFEEAEVSVRNNVTRVICGNFSTAGEAYNRLNRLHTHKGFEEAWVMKNVKNVN